MKTSDLIADLARDLPPSLARLTVTRRFASALSTGLGMSLSILVLWLGAQDMARASAIAGWWLKFGYSAFLGLAGLALALRLARPDGGRTRWLLTAVLLAIGGMLALGAAQLLAVPQEDRMALMMGQSWQACSRRVLTLAAPTLVLALLALRSLAPTRPALAGAAAGLMAGGVGAAVYAFHCPEMAPAFVAIWYSAGIAASAGLGALLGWRLLRW